MTDLFFIFQWWFLFFIIDVIFLPLTTLIFSNFFDKGYIFSKVIGMLFISYAVFILGILRILPFEKLTIILTVFIFLIINFIILFKDNPSLRIILSKNWKIFLFEETLFLMALFFWSYIRGLQPDIHGLEKFMDFGFVNSILRADYFPPKDMWFTPFSINYYYFGHLITAVLTKLSNIPSFITYNLMIATIFAFTFTEVFSIAANLLVKFKSPSSAKASEDKQNSKQGAGFGHLIFENLKLFQASNFDIRVFIAGILSAFLVTFAGNFHTIYTFFKPYVNENPQPFWTLPLSILTFPNSYWYPNATRFIYNTIHEFPIYSFVVSDLHGHVLDIPVVLLMIAFLFSIISKSEIRNPKQSQMTKIQNSKQKSFGHLIFENLNLFRVSIFDIRILLLGFILAIMYMTNVWDAAIYFLLSAFILAYITFKKTKINLKEIQSAKFKVQNYPDKFHLCGIPNGNYHRDNLKFKSFTFAICLLVIGVSAFIFSLPFSLSFKPFASGIGILCAPEFLTNIGKIGPFLFEPQHCQKSPWWQLLTLYGFFYFWVIAFFIFIFKRKNTKQDSGVASLPRMTSFWRLKGVQNLFRVSNFDIRVCASDIFILILILLSTLLIIIPEFIYAKDIYPAHYRANTMFKFVYQAFIMLSISSGYIIVRIITNIKYPISNIQYRIGNLKFEIGIYLKFICLFLVVCAGLFLVGSYPYFAINSYYGNFQNYKGLNGTAYLKNSYPTDYAAILWINENIKGQPIILEAQGDSYTDYARISANTGLPTVLGWTVHEWLWRGTYDIPAPRIGDINNLYESKDYFLTKTLIKKYNISYVFLGDLEKQKYTNLNEEKFKSLGKLIYQNGNTKIYKIY